jgi:hypothetical protein
MFVAHPLSFVVVVFPFFGSLTSTDIELDSTLILEDYRTPTVRNNTESMLPNTIPIISYRAPICIMTSRMSTQPVFADNNRYVSLVRVVRQATD